MSFLSQFFSGGNKNTDVGTYGVGLATGFSSQIPVDLMLIGGGGGGGSVKNTTYGPTFTNIPSMIADSYQGGGGGVGRVLVYNNCIVNTGVAYPITVGAGGAANQRGGTSIFGILRAGGGGRGAGTNPDGTAQTPDVQDLWSGSEGGVAMSHTLLSAPYAAALPAQAVYLAGVTPSTRLTQGTKGRLFFSDQPISASFVGSPLVAPNPASPFYPVYNNSYLTNATNIFKQSVNSVVFGSPNGSSTQGYSQPFVAHLNVNIPDAQGQGGVGGCLPHFTKVPFSSSADTYIFYNAYNNVFRNTSLPSTQVQDNYQYFPGNTPTIPRNPLQDTKDFIADFFFGAGITSPLTDGIAGSGGGGLRTIGGSYNPATGGYGPSTFDRVTPYIYSITPTSVNYPLIYSGGFNSVPRNYDYARTAIVSTPIWNTITSAGGSINIGMPTGGGNITNPTIPYGVAIPGIPLADTPFATQTDKLVTWTANPLIDLPIAGGSPGNGGGGSGGNRVGPTLLQGTVSIPKYSSFIGPIIPTSVPYALNIAGSPLSYASGGAGGSGSVWVIYPTDYAAATVVGNTPVPSPPAFRVYRWDGAGSITFNAS